MSEKCRENIIYISNTENNLFMIKKKQSITYINKKITTLTQNTYTHSHILQYLFHIHKRIRIYLKN